MFIMFQIAALMIAVFAATTKSAYAYIDPATGALVLQMLVAAFATAAATVKLWWKKVTGFFRKDVAAIERKPEPAQDAAKDD